MKLIGAQFYASARMTRRKGISSSTDTGVCPNCWRNLFDSFFLRLRILPRSMTNVTFIANTINFDSSEVKFAKVHDGALC